MKKSIRVRIAEIEDLLYEWWDANQIAQHLGNKPKVVNAVLSDMARRDEIRRKPANIANRQINVFCLRPEINSRWLITRRWA